MAFIGSLLGAGQGSDFVAPTDQNKEIVNPVTAGQTTQAYDQTQAGLAQQAAFTQALGAQGGIGNQTAAFNQQQGLAGAINGAQGAQNQSQLSSQLAGVNGVQNQQNVFGQLQGVANGTGPNPAQAQLAQATGANVANQAALMAGQRGASQNVGLIARQAAQQGANIQQQAAGQAATLQAGQSLNALGQLGGVAQNQIGNQAAVAQAQIGQQQTANNALAAQAGQQVGQQAGAIQGYNQAAQSSQANLLGGVANSNNAQASIMGSQNQSNAQIQVQNSKAQQGILGGVFGGAGSFLAEGGEVGVDGKAPAATAPEPEAEEPKGGILHRFGYGGKVAYADGGAVAGPSSSVGRFLYGSAGQNAQSGQPQQLGSQSTFSDSNPIQSGSSQLFSKLAQNYIKPAAQDLFSSAPTVDPNGIGAQFNAAPQAPTLGGSTDLGAAMSGQGLGAAPEAGSVPQGSAGYDPNLGVNTDLGAGLDSSAVGTDAAASEGAEGAATAGEAAEGAEAVEGASAASEAAELVALLAKGGKVGKSAKKVPAMVSPGEVYLSPKQVAKVAAGKADPINAGEKIKGQAKVKGDSYANDTVPKTLEKGGIVLPRHVTEAKNPHWAAHAFVKALMARKGGLGGL